MSEHLVVTMPEGSALVLLDVDKFRDDMAAGLFRKRTERAPAGFPRRGQTHCLHGHEMTEENTYTRHDGYTQCLTCKRASQAKSRAKMRALREAS